MSNKNMSADSGINATSLDKILLGCAETQSMIDITAKQLSGLRQCRASGQLIKKEICESESKLIKLFSKILVAKSKFSPNNMPARLRNCPRTDQWLQIVGINNKLAKALCEKWNLQSMLELHPQKLESKMQSMEATAEDIEMLATALHNLKLWTELQLTDGKTCDIELHWSAFKSACNSPYGGSSPKFGHHQRPSTSSLPGDTSLAVHSPTQSPPSPIDYITSSPFGNSSDHQRRFTPPPTPLVKSQKGKFPTTPPPQKKNKLYPDAAFQPLTKSKSHESQLSLKVSQDSVDLTKILKKKPGNIMLTSSSEAISQQRKRSSGAMDEASLVGRASVSGQSSPLLTSPFRSPQFKSPENESWNDNTPKMSQLAVPPPVSPAPSTVNSVKVGSGRSMMHDISHKFQSRLLLSSCDHCHKPVIFGRVCKRCKYQNKLVMSTCDLCRKHIFRGCVCKYCKSKFHKDCATKAPPSCGLSDQLVDCMLKLLPGDDGSPDFTRRLSTVIPSHERGLNHSAPSASHPLDSSSATSSCNSSTPSSPAVANIPTYASSSPGHSWRYQEMSCPPDTHFPYPDPATMDSTYGSLSGYSSSTNPTVSVSIDTNTSNDSDKSDKTVIDVSLTGSGGSGDRYSIQLDRVDSVESSEDLLSQLCRDNSISVTLKEWDIPFEELIVGEVIGVGRFGTVYKGNWHGDVAIKVLNMDPYLDNKAQLSAFKLEVAMLRKTRHENLVLFMGACMTPPKLAIITSLSKGQTLFSKLHVRREKMPLNQIVMVASQIAQGMGYLHAKGIVHKDLKTKNVFLESLKLTGTSENFKVVITDFGLFSVTKLCHGSRKGNWLSIPPGWLCYLAPEIVRSLRAGSETEMDLPFSNESDMYAFGTVWYELLCGEWPFKKQPPESIIWQVGKGMRQSLTNIQASRDLKDVLMQCWAYKPKERPDCREILQILDRLPKKRVARSPSHPVQLSRSAESIF